MSNQVIDDEVPEYRQSKNAPSHNAIDEAYKKGYDLGYINGKATAFMWLIQELKNLNMDADTVDLSTLWKRLEKIKANHHHGDE